MNTDKLKSMVKAFDQLNEVRELEEQARKEKEHRRRSLAVEETFRWMMTEEALEALTDAGFRWTADPDENVIELGRISSSKKLRLLLPPFKAKALSWNGRTYNLSSPKGELDLLSEIAFQFGV